MRLIKIGRDASNDYVAQHPAVSARHAELLIKNDGTMELTDIGSTHGTTINNGQPINRNTPYAVRFGDKITLSGVLTLNWNQIPRDDFSDYTRIYDIGSGHLCAVQLTAPTVSRYHATVAVDNKNRAFLIDHSKNGCTINGKPVAKGQPERIKPGDVVMCGGVKLNKVHMDKILPPVTPWKKILIGAAACIALIAGGWGIYSLLSKDKAPNGPVVALADSLGNQTAVPTLTPNDLTPATVYVRGDFYVTIEFDDNPFPELFKKYNVEWPSKYYISFSGNADNPDWRLTTNRANAGTVSYGGTAFFINRQGLMATNRHVAAPWEYLDALIGDGMDIEIKGIMEAYRNSQLPIAQITNMDELKLMARSSQLGANLYALLTNGSISLSQVRGYINAFRNSKIKITGEHAFLGIAYPDRNYNSTAEFAPCTIVKESGNDNLDVALITLNDKKTPSDIQHLFSLDNARTDVSELKPQAETFYTIGYPSGLVMNLDNRDGGLKPMINNLTVSKTPGDYSIQMQGESMGGASGSPIIDSKGRLIGVLWGGWRGNNVIQACEVKYLKQLYEGNISEGSKTKAYNTYSDN